MTYEGGKVAFFLIGVVINFLGFVGVELRELNTVQRCARVTNMGSECDFVFCIFYAVVGRANG